MGASMGPTTDAAVILRRVGFALNRWKDGGGRVVIVCGMGVVSGLAPILEDGREDWWPTITVIGTPFVGEAHVAPLHIPEAQ